MYIVETGLTWVILSWIEDTAITARLKRQQKAAQHHHLSAENKPWVKPCLTLTLTVTATFGTRLGDSKVQPATTSNKRNYLPSLVD